MTINNATATFSLYNNSQNRSDDKSEEMNEVKAQNLENTSSSSKENESSLSVLSSMSLDEIKSYLENKHPSKNTEELANSLFKLQEFANEIDPDLYTQMEDALLAEKGEANVSMRYHSFPTSQMLEEDEKMFNAVLKTSLSIKDAPESVIFHLNLKQDFDSYKEDVSKAFSPYEWDTGTLDLDVDFSAMTFMGYIKKQLEKIQEDIEQGGVSNPSVIKNLEMLLGSYNASDGSKNYPQVDILV